MRLFKAFANRTVMMSVSLILLFFLVGSVLYSCKTSSQNNEPFKFALVTDTHIVGEWYKRNVSAMDGK